MTTEHLSWLFNVSYRALNGNVKGIDHTESLIYPEAGGNNLNWIVGHIIASRNDILKLVEEEIVLSEKDAYYYRRGAQPKVENSPLDFYDLLSAYTEADNRLKNKLNLMSDADLNKIVKSFNSKYDDEALIEQLTFLFFHESYHVGQTGLMRRFLKREGVIK